MQKNRTWGCRRRHGLWFAGVFFGMIFATAQAVPERFATARIDVEAADRQTVLKPGAAGIGAQLRNFDWVKPGAWGIYVNFPFSGEWRNGDCSFTPSRTGKAVLLARGPFARAGKRPVPVEAEFASLRVNGVELLAEPVAVTHDRPRRFPLEFTAGETVRISARYRVASAWVDRSGSCPLDFGKIANMGFADPVAGDGAGGWSDQGPGNDLAGIRPGKRVLDGASFELLDPARNGGRAVVTFTSANAPGVALRKVDLPLPQVAEYTYLYLLHAAGFGRGNAVAGTIRCDFADGGTATHEVRLGRDLADWWQPQKQENAAVAERIVKNSWPTGFYLSQFRLSDRRRPIRRIELETRAGEPVWIVLAATLGNRPLELRNAEAPQEPYTVTAGGEWRYYRDRDLAVRPGSILDFSELCEFRPITEAERVTVADGRFQRQGKRIRFTGCSSTESQTLGKWSSKAEIEAYVSLIRRQGYNLYRPHFLDFFLMEKSTEDLAFNPVNLDKFDYLVDCLKKAGIYLYLDGMTGWSGYYRGSGWDWAPKGLPNLKSTLFSDDGARRHWAAGVTRLLTRRNPYTGMRLADDPVLLAVLPFNEQEWSEPMAAPAALRRWREKSGRPDAPFPKLAVATPEAREARFFMAELYRELSGFYLETLRGTGYRGAVTQFDCYKDLRSSMARSRFDAISMHNYHTHPWDWMRPGSVMPQTSSIRDGFRKLCEMFVLRQPGKPFLITEYLHCFWNRYRFEQGLSEGALAAFQDVDAIMNHQLPVMPERGNEPIATFRIYQDPVARASEVVGNALFRSPDMARAAEERIFRFDATALLRSGYSEKPFPEQLLPLALQMRTAIDFSTDPKTAPHVVRCDETLWSAAPGDFRVNPAATGFRLRREEGIFEVALPRIAGVAATEGGKFTLGDLTLGSSAPGAFTLISRDGAPLAESGRMLLVVATDALNDRMRFENRDRLKLLHPGNPETLVRTVQLTVSLRRRGGDAPFRLFAVRANGTRAGELPVAGAAGELRFAIDTAGLKDGPALFFELVRADYAP